MKQNLSLGIYENDSYDILGLKVENIDMKNVKNKIEGVRIYAVENNRNQSDLMVDDIIVKIGQSKINSVDQYTKELKKYSSGDSILLYINRNESSRFVEWKLNKIYQSSPQSSSPSSSRYSASSANHSLNSCSVSIVTYPFIL